MTVSFVILGYKEPHYVRLSIKNILALDLPFTYEIIYVDNKSNVDIASMVRTQYPSVRVIENPTNVGHPSGNNVGIIAASGKYIALLNPDVIIRSSDDVEQMINYMDSHADVGLLGPKLRNPDSSVQATCYRPYGRFTPIYRRTFLGKHGPGKRDIARHLMTDFDHNDTRAVDWLIGAFLFVRKTAIDQVGLMNQGLFLYFGDYEWCDRFRDAGWQVVYFHNTKQIYHYYKRESAGRRLSVMQAFSYFTRIHILDWLRYKRIKKKRNITPTASL